jgi:hypothetical protein
LVKHEAATIAIVEISRMHDGHQQVAFSVNKDVAFASRDFLAAVKPSRPACMGLHRLTINDRSAGSGITSCVEARQLAEACMDPPPRPVETPLAKIPIHRGPGTVLAWHIAPGAARPQQVEEAVENPPQIDAARTPTWLGRREQGVEQGPFMIAEVTGIDT